MTPARYNGKHPGGRPSKYDPKCCQQIIDYFNIPATKILKKITKTKSGTEIVEDIEVANSLPTIEGFANSIETMTETIVNWTKEYPEFLTAYTRAKAFQKEILIQNGTKNLYQPQFTIFVAKNCTDMHDRQAMDVEVTAKTVFGETERSARLIFLLEQVEKRAIEAANDAAIGS